MTETIEVGLGARTYPIHIGAGVLDGLAGAWADRLKPRRLSIIADQAVWDAHGGRLSAHPPHVKKMKTAPRSLERGAVMSCRGLNRGAERRSLLGDR